MTPTGPEPAPLSMAADWLVQAAAGSDKAAQPSRWLATLLERDRAAAGAAAAELALDLGELGQRAGLRGDAALLGRDEVARRAGEHAAAAGRAAASVADVAWAILVTVAEGAAEPASTPEPAPATRSRKKPAAPTAAPAPASATHAPAPAQDSRVVRVFVSSTFRDMGAERDELVKRTFPALRKLCESRGVTWGEVDLRWGITDEQRSEGQVLPICLAEIRGCRPYFIGMLGERYGWVPDTIAPATIEQEPWLAEHAGRSVTELEILHGVLNDRAMADHSFFYLRDPAYVEGKPPEQFRETPTADEIASLGAEGAAQRAEDRQAKLAALKERIRTAGLPLHEDYPDPRTLGELVLADLTGVIESLYPAGSEPDPLAREAAEHEAFARSRAGVYIGRAEYFERLDAHAAGDGPPLVVVGESGLGKSALLANWALRYRAAHPSDLVLMHFIGASPTSTDWAALARRIVGELKRRFALQIELPDSPDALRPALANALHMTAARARVVLVIDALNQLEDRDGALDLTWLPPSIPPNVQLVVSTLPGRSLAETERRGWPTLAVAPLSPAERRTLIGSYLAQYSRQLSDARTAHLADAPQTASPLYLRALLEELRVFGVHEQLDERIDHYLAAGSLDRLFELILERYEADYERDRPGLVRDAFSLLWAARRGLSETELLDLLGVDGQPLPRAFWSPLYLAAEPSLTSRAGLLGFFHDYLRVAVVHRYLPGEVERQASHMRLADYYAAREFSLRMVDELPWQLAQARAWERLVGLLAEPVFLMEAWLVNPFEIQAYWAQAELSSTLRMSDAYRPVVAAPSRFPPDFIFVVALLLRRGGNLEPALELQRFASDQLRAAGDKSELAASLNERASMLLTQGRTDEAMVLYKEAEQASASIGDERGRAIALNNQANILGMQGNSSESMVLYKETERIFRQLGDRQAVANSLGNQAAALRARGQLDEAMTLQLESERICIETGDMRKVAVSLGERASIHFARGELDRAMALFKEQEQICRDHGDKHMLATSLDSQGTIHYTRGDPERAMALYKEAERIAREADDKRCLAVALNNQANILDGRDDVDGAMALYEEAGRIAREMQDVQGIAASLGNRANLFDNAGRLDMALPLYEEAERALRGAGDVQRLAATLANHAMALLNANRFSEGVPLIQEAYRLATEHGLVSMIQQLQPIMAGLGLGGPGSRR